MPYDKNLHFKNSVYLKRLSSINLANYRDGLREVKSANYFGNLQQDVKNRLISDVRLKVKASRKARPSKTAVERSQKD
jgi:hypothetical protein